MLIEMWVSRHVEFDLLCHGCSLVIARRRETSHPGDDVNNTHRAMINPHIKMQKLHVAVFSEKNWLVTGRIPSKSSHSCFFVVWGAYAPVSPIPRLRMGSGTHSNGVIRVCSPYGTLGRFSAWILRSRTPYGFTDCKQSVNHPYSDGMGPVRVPGLTLKFAVYSYTCHMLVVYGTLTTIYLHVCGQPPK